MRFTHASIAFFIGKTGIAKSNMDFIKQLPFSYHDWEQENPTSDRLFNKADIYKTYRIEPDAK